MANAEDFGLKIEEITADGNSEDILHDLLVKIEQVHKMRGVDELVSCRLAKTKNHLKSSKHCFGAFYPEIPIKPAAVTYAYMATLPESPSHADYKELPGDITQVRDAPVTELAELPNTMIFYSVTNPNRVYDNWFPALKDAPLGDIVIEGAVEWAKKQGLQITKAVFLL